MRELLDTVALRGYAALFEEEEVDVPILGLLSDADLAEVAASYDAM